MSKMMNQIKYRFAQSANVFKLYIYDNVTAYGDFNWETWEYDESETSANYFREQLANIPNDGKIELHINSYGGDVKEGIAIYNMLKQHTAEKVCYIDGFAYSIASVIAMACDRIVMGLGTSMLIHNMSTYIYGNATQLRKMADDLDVLMDSNRKIYMERAKDLTEEELKDMMDKETYLTPEQCLKYGFCDEIGTYTVDTDKISQQAAMKITQLQQQLNEQQSFKEEMAKLVQSMQNKPMSVMQEEPKTEPEEQNNTSNDKVLKLMGAFFNAFNTEREVV